MAMATKKTTSKKNVSADKITAAYMEWVLTKEKAPLSVYKFCKENNFTETEFYKHFGSFNGLQIAIWNDFYEETIRLANRDEGYETYTNKEKMLTFFYTFFELLTLNRSYVLFTLRENQNVMKNLSQLKELRNLSVPFSMFLIPSL